MKHSQSLQYNGLLNIFINRLPKHFFKVLITIYDLYLLMQSHLVLFIVRQTYYSVKPSISDLIKHIYQMTEIS